MPTVRLDDRALISVQGPDARSFLQGLLTQDVDSLESGELRYGALLGPQGRLLADLFLLGEPEGILLDCRAEQRDALLQRLSLYRLRANVRLAADDRSVFAAWGTDMAGWPADPRLPNLGRRFYGAVVPNQATDDWRKRQLDLGVPSSEDFRLDVDYPIECNLDLLNGIAFHKGCFVGQEVTSRMKRRGKVKSRLLPVSFDGAAPSFGQEVLRSDLRAGEIRSSCDGRGMALLRLDRLDGSLTVEGQRVQVHIPDWLDLAG